MRNTETAKPANRSFLGTLLAIAWSFIGLRRKKDFDRDVTSFNPVYVLIAALLGTAIFIALLLAIVYSVVP